MEITAVLCFQSRHDKLPLAVAFYKELLRNYK